MPYTHLQRPLIYASIEQQHPKPQANFQPHRNDRIEPIKDTRYVFVPPKGPSWIICDTLTLFNQEWYSKNTLEYCTDTEIVDITQTQEWWPRMPDHQHLSTRLKKQKASRLLYHECRPMASCTMPMFHVFPGLMLI